MQNTHLKEYVDAKERERERERGRERERLM